MPSERIKEMEKNEYQYAVTDNCQRGRLKGDFIKTTGYA